MKKNIALIGGGGFIGTNLANFFNELSYKVLIIGRNVKESINDDVNSIDRKLVDVNKTSKLIESIEDYENVVWLVNDLLPSSSMDSLIDDFTFNVSPLINFMEKADKLKNLKKFIFISSGGTIYGEPINKLAIKEEDNKNPISAYGLSKIIAENYVKYITLRSSYNSIILRPSNVYGSYQNLKKPQGVVGYAFNALINDKQIDLYGDGKVIRDFVHVLDFANAIKLCLENDKLDKVEIFNIGSQKGYSIKEILKYIENIAHSSIKTLSKKARNFDCEYNILNIEKIKNKIGWEPKIEIEDGLQSVWNWLKMN
jgi:UDP-glucose 4-epimerase